MPGFAFAVLRISCPAPLTFFVHRAEAFLLGVRVARLPAEPTVGRFKLVKEGVAFAYLLPASEGACDSHGFADDLARTQIKPGDGRALATAIRKGRKVLKPLKNPWGWFWTQHLMLLNSGTFAGWRSSNRRIVDSERHERHDLVYSCMKHRL